MTTAVTRLPAPATDDRAHAARADLLHQVEDRLRAFLAGESARWSAVDGYATAPVDAISTLTTAGGKRIRPLFCVTGFLAAGGDPTDGSVVHAAAAWELLHACALIHDDVMDESALRRGMPTAHVRHAREHRAHGWRGAPDRYGESVALLAGDLALVYADNLMAAAGPAVRDIWDEARVELIIGQFLDTSIEVRGRPNARLAHWIAHCKSGRYTIERPLTLGATLAGRPGLVPAFERYGAPLGEAFQLRDDLLDIVGDPAVVGKPTAADLERHKMTLLMSLAMERHAPIRDAVRAGLPVRDLLVETGTCAIVEHRIERLVHEACAALDRAPLPAWWRRELGELALRVAYRDR
jgi:geranylgeranyl diphosphate synthase type I